MITAAPARISGSGASWKTNGPIGAAPRRHPRFSLLSRRGKSATVVVEVVMVLSEASGPAMAAWLAQATGAAEATVRHIERLGGGAIQENWAVDIVCRGGRLDGQHRLVLRTDASSRVAVSWDRSQEFRILEVAYHAGVTAPEPIALCTDPTVLGRPFYLMRRVAGEARGFKLVRDPAVLARGEQ